MTNLLEGDSQMKRLLTASAPINLSARLVVSGHSDHWAVSAPAHMAHTIFEAPPHCHPSPADEPDSSGLRRGKLVALKFCSRNRNGKSVWLMRCDCGMYTIRHIRGWVKRGASILDQCVMCERRAAVTSPSPSRACHGPRRSRWLGRLRTAGFQDGEIAFIETYSLDTDDLAFLRKVLDSLLPRPQNGAASNE